GVPLVDAHAARNRTAGAFPGIAADHDNAAAHARGLARQRAAEPFRRGPGNLDRSSAHAGSRPGAGTAGDRELAAAHASAGPKADVAFDHDLALAHVLREAVEPVACILDPELGEPAR